MRTLGTTLPDHAAAAGGVVLRFSVLRWSQATVGL